ncbi:MAG: cytochrome c [Flavobacteriales bacterium]|nr:cytochrome c [Flavobacteriales bacterium]
MNRTALILFLLVPTLGFQILPQGEPWKAPPEADKLVDAMANDPKAVQKGQKIFTSLCWVCHGMAGKGDGPNAAALKVHPADLGSRTVQAQTNGAIYWKITHGRGEMASYEQVISREQRWALVHYLRTLKSNAE